MSAEDGSRTGSPDVENTLVAALGFEPTAPAGASDVLVDDGSGDALDWSSGDSDERLSDSPSGLQEDSAAADGGGTGNPSNAKAAASMNPPKGKGKGPRTFADGKKKSSKKDEKEPGSDDSRSTGSARAKSAKKKTESLKSDAPVETVKVGFSDTSVALDDDPETDQDPADLLDADSSGVKPLNGDSPDDEVTSDGPADKAATAADDKRPSTAAETIIVDSADATGPLPVGLATDDLDETGPLPVSKAASATATVSDSLTVDSPPAAPATTATAVVDDLPGAPTEATPIVAEALTETPVADAAPVLDPPPPMVGDPVPEAPAVEANGAVAGAVVSNRVGSGAAVPEAKRELSTKLPQLLDQDFLKRSRRVRARKVRRVVRHIDPWSVLTFSVLFFLCLFAALLLASVLVWNAAVAAGTIENIEKLIRDVGDYQTFTINGDVVFRGAMVIAGILTLATSVMAVLLVVVFNLISDLVGGIRITVIEEETVRVRRRKRARQ